MSARLINSETWTNQPKNILLAYETLDAGTDAVSALMLLEQRTRQASHGTRNYWRFDMLSQPLLRRKAARDAAAADVVIVSAEDYGELSAGVRAWLHEWIACEGNSPKTLVALLDDAGAEIGRHSAIEAYLRECAGLVGIEFYVRRIRTNPLGEADISGAGEKAEQMAEALEQILSGRAESEQAGFLEPFETLAGILPVHA